MYIKSIVIDGFKSYAQRTEINGFDHLFNAITGLNGSGKSNILDSICFLLGISNLSQVRATNLQDLVYKSGQAGVTKATVSIVFDNLDKKHGPLGYEQYDEITVTRQVVIGGRNKYMINGMSAQHKRVQDLFQSVQLNVNNPHFLIMQGRITKVLNMKPPEILSMIEEAAGTRLYETKKESAQRTIEKKDAKLAEIETVLREDINPTLTKLREERSSYLEFQKITRELEHLTKLYIAYQFMCAEDRKKKSADEVVEITETIGKLEEKSKEVEESIQVVNKQIQELEAKKEKESGEALSKVQKDLSDANVVHAKILSACDSKKESMKAEEKKKKSLVKQKDDNTKTIATREKDLEKILSATEKLQKQSIQDAEDFAAAQKHFHAVTAGLSSNDDGEAATLNDQLLTAKNEISNTETEIKQAEMRLKHSQDVLKKKSPELKKTEQSYKKDQIEYNKMQDNLNKLQMELKKLNYDEEKVKTISAERKRLFQEVQKLQEKTETLEAKFPQLNFEYKDPERNFNRSTVHGLLCKLVRVNSPETGTALEVVAGSKLYNIVVDNEIVGKKLVQNGQLKRRYTIIPLDKIVRSRIHPDAVKKAEKLVGKENVHTALSLIGYEKELSAAMEYVFGTSFVCKDMGVAKTVTFHEAIMKRSVTLDGESFNPAGTLTGGSRPQNSSILVKLQELTEVEKELVEKKNLLNKIEAELNALQKMSGTYNKLKNEFELKQHETELLKTRLEQTSHHQQLEEINALEKTIEEQKAIVQTAGEVNKKAKQKVKDLEFKIKNADKIRENELKQAEANLNKIQKQMQESNKLMKEKQQHIDTVKLEIVELQKEVTSYEEQLKSVATVLDTYSSELKEIEEKLTVCQATVKEAQDNVNKQKELLNDCNTEIRNATKSLKAFQEKAKKIDLENQELEHKRSKLQKESKDTTSQVENWLKKYEWIVDEKKFFGKPNTAYDFTVNDPVAAEQRIHKLQEIKDKLGHNINMRAMNMLEKAEEECNDLMAKRKIVLNDKMKIAQVIAELDEMKKAALKKAWEQVNKDFGSIFSSLLPGTDAKLSPPEGMTVLDGLEVKVAFGDVWKESLGELSGGQRSLVALSLILAMLLFKPAPIYILDEVDAALDLSHTQNIGHMIKNHFKHSQFIVVSLKDGMFNNANVLFKTKFVDGVSTVTRHTQSQKSSHTSKDHSSSSSSSSSSRKKQSA
ncbi:maintenance of chromosomes 2-like [Octopus vulgaris]|uniref:Structural maintenance of chromosomes protein n=1 Tax=Octopus vulgaris TaxID=6645 RepID=A0AA36F978_OCTVU|nr:maintenance of chromosomes 2-like [Octopus vulgaris]